MKRYNIILSLIAVLVLFASCEDFLTQEPRLMQTTELTLSTYDGMMNAAVAAYSPMYYSTWYARDFLVTADLKGGNSKISPITSGRFVQTYLWAEESYGLWTAAYDAIARANNIITALDGFEEPGVEETDLLAVEAEAKFIRAISYFDLARIFCPAYNDNANAAYGLPVVLVTELGEPARNTVPETYAQIVEDLEFAAANLPAATIHEAGADLKGFATQNAAIALLARVNLYMENWQEAADLASEIITSMGGADGLYDAEKYTVWNDPNVDGGGVWGTDAAKEIIFEIFGSEGNSAHPNWDQITYIMSPNGYGDIGASKDVMDLYEPDDVRLGLFTNTADFPNDYWSLKYPGKGGNLRIDDIPVLRLAEMFLIRAEAALEGASTGSSATADLNAIRSHRNASDLTNVTLQDVYQERRRELCYEGHELFDLKRTNRGLVRNDYDGTINKDVPYPDHRWNAMIPKAELDANPNMVQNPGYSSAN